MCVCVRVCVCSVFVLVFATNITLYGPIGSGPGVPLVAVKPYVRLKDTILIIAHPRSTLFVLNCILSLAVKMTPSVSPYYSHDNTKLQLLVTIEGRKEGYLLCSYNCLKARLWTSVCKWVPILDH